MKEKAEIVNFVWKLRTFKIFCSSRPISASFYFREENPFYILFISICLIKYARLQLYGLGWIHFFWISCQNNFSNFTNRFFVRVKKDFIHCAQFRGIQSRELPIIFFPNCSDAAVRRKSAATAWPLAAAAAPSTPSSLPAVSPPRVSVPRIRGSWASTHWTRVASQRMPLQLRLRWWRRRRRLPGVAPRPPPPPRESPEHPVPQRNAAPNPPWGFQKIDNSHFCNSVLYLGGIPRFLLLIIY